MKLVSYSVPVLILLLSFFYNTNPFVVKEEAKQAYNVLNTARHSSNNTLHWNDTLAKVAEAKALDMARRNYTGPVDPNGYKINHYMQESGYDHANYYESVAVGAANGAAAIKTLMSDKAYSKWNNSMADVGIGYVKCDVGKHRSYACIIIAKHD